MRCCSNKTTEEDENKCGMVPSSDRKCRDIFCCLLFMVYWVGMMGIAIVGIKKGNPGKLVYGKDFKGDICGVGPDYETKPLLYYTQLNEDMLYALRNNIPYTEMQYAGICVSSCPQEGDERCDTINGNTTCWTSAMATENVFFRCLPLAAENKTVLERTCIDPVDGDVDCTVLKLYLKQCAKLCKAVKEKSIGYEAKETTTNPVLEQMQGTAQLVGRLIGDLEKAGPLVLAIGGAGAFVLGVVWLVFLQYFAGLMVWLTCFLVIITLVVLSLYCSVKAEIINPNDFPQFSSLGATVQLDEQLQAAHSTEKSQFTVAAYVLWILTIVLFVLILAMRKRIRIAIAIIREASRCIKTMPLLMLWPIIPSIFILGLVAYWMTIAAYILSSDDITVSDLQSAAGTDVDISVNVSLSSGNGTQIESLGQVPNPTMQDVLFVYHIFGLLWTNQLIQAISICTIGGAVASYYWTLPDEFGNRSVGRFPIASALKRTIRYNIGSLCFGSLVIALVQLMRLFLEYIDHNTKGLQDSNAMVKVIMKAVKCCLWCFEKCLKFLSKNAYIIISMKGSSFCNAARQAFMLILANIARVATVNSVSFFLLLLAKITITTGTGALIFSMLSASAEYAMGGEKELSSPICPLLVTCLLAWFVSSSFMNVYDMAIDTILVCFCEDTKLNNQGSSEYMSEELRKIMGDTGSSDKERNVVKVSPKKQAI